MRLIFPSVMQPNIRYALCEKEEENRGYSWNSSRSVISRHLLTFDTLGDGECQHTSDLCPRNDWETLQDFVVSVLPVAGKMEGDLLSNLYRTFVPYHLPSAELMDFIKTKAVYDPDKQRTYVKFDECKKSTAESKGYDKRWVRVESHFDGTIEAVRRAMSTMSEYRFIDPLQSVFIDMVIERHFGGYEWNLSTRYRNVSGGIFQRADESQLEAWLGWVYALGKYLTAKVECIGLQEQLSRMSERAAEKVVAA